MKFAHFQLLSALCKHRAILFLSPRPALQSSFAEEDEVLEKLKTCLPFLTEAVIVAEDPFPPQLARFLQRVKALGVPVHLYTCACTHQALSPVLQETDKVSVHVRAQTEKDLLEALSAKSLLHSLHVFAADALSQEYILHLARQYAPATVAVHSCTQYPDFAPQIRRFLLTNGIPCTLEEEDLFS